MQGNGFIAAFVAGLSFGNTLKRKCRFLYEFAESEGQILILLSFGAFGIALLGTGVHPVTSLFLGWFGPRGLASILFVLLIVEKADLPNEALVSTAVVLTVALSILLHGISAGPVTHSW